MTFDRKKLFAGLRPKFGKLDGVQQSTIAAVVDKFEERGLTDIRWLAYMLATAWGECQFRPVREGFAKTDAGARQAVARLHAKGRIKKNYALPDKATGKSYYGRGLVQLTFKSNYKTLGERLNLDLVNDPDLALTVPVAVAIMFEGMIGGLFTGKKLSDYFNGVIDKPEAARRIINGTDKASAFAGWHKSILEGLRAAVAPAKPETANTETAQPDATSGNPATDPAQKGLIASLLALLGIGTAGAGASGVASGLTTTQFVIGAVVVAAIIAGVAIYFIKRRSP